jgi:polysaccharide pyruvyl transferase WcaK-like protein
LPFHQPGDAAASATVCDVMMQSGVEAERIHWVTNALDPLEMMNEVEQCDALVGMRLHALIYSATRFVPCAGISYDPKIDRFLEQIDEQAVGTTESLVPHELATRLEGLIARREEWIAQRSTKIESLQQWAKVPASRIVEGLR